MNKPIYTQGRIAPPTSHNHAFFIKIIYYLREIIVGGRLSQTFLTFKESNFKATFIVPLQTILQLNQQQTYNFTLNYLPHEVFATLSVVLYYQKNFVFAPAIDDVIQKLQSAGLIEYWHYNYFKRKKVIRDSVKREKLKFEHLAGSFQILIGGCFLGIVVFLAEILLRKCRRAFN